jgi:hypothetical protein
MYTKFLEYFSSLSKERLGEPRKNRYLLGRTSYTVDESLNYISNRDAEVGLCFAQKGLLREQLVINVLTHELDLYQYDEEEQPFIRTYWVPGGVTEEEFFQETLVKDIQITFEENMLFCDIYQNIKRLHTEISRLHLIGGV